MLLLLLVTFRWVLQLWYEYRRSRPWLKLFQHVDTRFFRGNMAAGAICLVEYFASVEPGWNLHLTYLRKSLQLRPAGMSWSVY